LTKFDLYYAEELECDPDEIIEYDEHVEFEKNSKHKLRASEE
jgi:hypothetical protein